MFKAILVEKDEDSGKVSASLKSLETTDLPDEAVTVDVQHSTINYKDGLVLNGLGNLVREYPHVPGIDFAGKVSDSRDERFKPGDDVVLTGWRVGEVHWGGLAEKASVKADWLVPMPDALDSRTAMAIGTAGFTAMLGIMTLEENGLTPDKGPVLVTGAAGGVGSVACALLAEAGYEVEASTGRESTHDYLRSLGANAIIDRDSIAEPNGKPLNRERWAACVDAVGGATLANVLTQIRYGGAVASIGLAGGNKLDTTVIPFLLRGVSLLGIDSVMCPSEKRQRVWNRFSEKLPGPLESMIEDITLDDAIPAGKRILEGDIRGRAVVNVTG